MSLTNQLETYIPSESFAYAVELLHTNNIQLRISRPRKGKLGDFRPPRKGEAHRISVNSDLNKYAFLVTLLHEIAHAICWEKYKNKVKPHGVEWKILYSNILLQAINLSAFPKELTPTILKHVNKPKAGVAGDIPLERALMQYNITEDNTAITLLADLGVDVTFKLTQNNRTFKTIAKQRTRFKCKELGSRKIYLISGAAKVTVLIAPING